MDRQGGMLFFGLIYQWFIVVERLLCKWTLALIRFDFTLFLGDVLPECVT